MHQESRSPLTVHRRKLGLKAAALAKALGISESKLSAFENGRRKPDCLEIVSLAREYKLPTESMICLVESTLGWRAEQEKPNDEQGRK